MVRINPNQARRPTDGAFRVNLDRIAAASDHTDRRHGVSLSTSARSFPAGCAARLPRRLPAYHVITRPGARQNLLRSWARCAPGLTSERLLAASVRCEASTLYAHRAAFFEISFRRLGSGADERALRCTGHETSTRIIQVLGAGRRRSRSSIDSQCWPSRSRASCSRCKIRSRASRTRIGVFRHGSLPG